MTKFPTWAIGFVSLFAWRSGPLEPAVRAVWARVGFAVAWILLGRPALRVPAGVLLPLAGALTAVVPTPASHSYAWNLKLSRTYHVLFGHLCYRLRALCLYIYYELQIIARDQKRHVDNGICKWYYNTISVDVTPASHSYTRNLQKRNSKSERISPWWWPTAHSLPKSSSYSSGNITRAKHCCNLKLSGTWFVLIYVIVCYIF